MLPKALSVPVAIGAAASGIVLAVLGLGPAAGAFAGIAVVIGIAAVFSVTADRLAYVALGLLVVFINWNGIRLGGGAVGSAFMAAAAAAAVPLILREKRPIPLPPWLYVAGVGMFLAALLTLIFPPSPHLVSSSLVQAAETSPTTVVISGRSDLMELIHFELSWLVIPLLIAVVATSRRRCVQIMDLWTMSAVISAIVAVADFAGLAHLAPVEAGGDRVAGLTIHPNYLALNSALALPLALLWFGRGPRWNVAGLIGVMALLGGVYASGSRMGTLGCLFAVGVTTIAVPRLRRGLLLVLPCMGMVLIILLMFTNTGRQVLQQVRLDPGNVTVIGSNTQRELAADIAGDQFRARPLAGVGFAVISDAHNIYLQLLAAGGVIALGSFLVYCGGVLAAAWRAMAGPLRNEAIAAGVGVLMWLGSGFIDNQLADKYLYVVPGLLLAMSRVSTARHKTEIPSESVEAGGRPGRLSDVFSAPRTDVPASTAG